LAIADIGFAGSVAEPCGLSGHESQSRVCSIALTQQPMSALHAIHPQEKLRVMISM
jgi:hypothetical protein